MESVGIFEGGAHEQYLTAMCRISETVGETVRVFTTQEKFKSISTTESLNHGAFDWTVKDDDLSISKFYRSLEDATESLEVLIVLTKPHSIRELMQFVRLDLQCPTLLYIYNIETWFNTRPRLSQRVRGNIKRLLLGRIRRTFDGFVVEYPQFESYIQQCFDCPSHSVHTFPPVVYDQHQKTNRSDQFVVSVPGNVQSSRRDYDILLDGIEDSFRAYPDDLELRLVGPPIGEYGQGIMARCDWLRDQGFSIRTFDSRLDSQRFDNEMCESNLLVSPLRLTTKGSTGECELFGVTKGSGSVFDALRYQTPALFPDHFFVPQYVRQATESFKSAGDITVIINQFLNDADYRKQMESKARDASSTFVLERQRERFESLVETVR